MDSLKGPLEPIIRMARLKRFPKGQIILYEGDVPNEAYIMKSGIIKMYDIDEAGNEKILHLLKAPAIMPFTLLKPKVEAIHWFYTTVTDCEIYVLPVEQLEELFEKDSKLLRHVVGSFMLDVHELLVRLSSLGKSTVRDKLIAVLKFLVVCHAEPRRGNWYRVTFPVSHQLLADITGVTRESAAIAMKELQDEKVVRNPRLMTLEIDRTLIFDL